MTPSSPANPVALARTAMARLRAVLLDSRVEEIERELPALEAAAQALRTVSPDPRLRAELHELDDEVQRVVRLLTAAAEFNAGWARTLASSVSGYTSSGSAAPLTAGSTISVRG